MLVEPAKRVIAGALNVRLNDSASARFAGFDRFPNPILGLTPRLYAVVRSADSQN